MRIFYAGDIVGAPGRTVFARTVIRLKDQDLVDVVIVNGENAAHGRGITPKLADEIFEAGADAISLGDHTWDQRDIGAYLDRESRIVRPANFAKSCPGRGITTIQTDFGPITLMNLVGRVFTRPYDCPFLEADRLLKVHAKNSPVIIVDMHAEATSEKIAMGWYLDGRVSAVVGTHTHVQTSDERLLHKGTAFITDLGMTGPKDSVLGSQIEPVLEKFLTGCPARFGVAEDNPCCEGVIIDIDETTGKAQSITRVREN